MKVHKCTPRRLARFFETSRDKWKERAAKYYKKLRALQIKVRDLQHSRDYWKARAKQAENKRHSLPVEAHISEAGQRQDETQEAPKPSDQEIMSTTSASETDEVKEGELIPYTLSSGGNETALQIPSNHEYAIVVMQLAIDQIVNSFASLRGCRHSLEQFARFFHFPVPCYTTIRYWFLRLGLYQLQRPVAWRNDWIMLVDMTITLGEAHCLLVVGIPQAHLPMHSSSAGGDPAIGYALHHHDVHLLALEVMSHPTGEAVCAHLEALSAHSGPGRQILADHGSDIKKGIELYQQQHKETIYTYDITHQLALLLEGELKADERFQAFSAQCTSTRRDVQQTELYYLTPPAQRTKSRYHNIDRHVNWAQAILHYQEQGDFSALGTAFIMDVSTFEVAWEVLDQGSRKALCELPWRRYDSQEAFLAMLISAFGEAVVTEHGDELCQAADSGKRRFAEKLGWVGNYREEIALYGQFMELVESAEKQVKDQGLNRQSKAFFEATTQDTILLPRAQQFKAKVIDYLDQEGEKIPPGQTLLGTTDVLESIIGKLKAFIDKSPLQELSSIILSVPLVTTKIAGDLVKKAMESVREVDVDNWAKRTFGKSALAKRRALLGAQKEEQKSHENRVQA